jgi:tripartite-type tricarboxylate transporter receptor subunit TctC
VGIDLDIQAWVGIFAPAATPRDIVNRINAEINKMMLDAKFRQQYLDALTLDPVGGSPADFAAFLRAERDVYAELVKIAKVRFD